MISYNLFGGVDMAINKLIQTTVSHRHQTVVPTSIRKNIILKRVQRLSGWIKEKK
jgi:bifunctional DNA-binding transcriptional regulator/antitoxin component of YhaV-PrlF toxin-antitoxin module